jgi:hypothetical protein
MFPSAFVQCRASFHPWLSHHVAAFRLGPRAASCTAAGAGLALAGETLGWTLGGAERSAEERLAALGALARLVATSGTVIDGRA